MSFEDQTMQRKLSLFRQSLRFQEVGAGVFVQRVPARYVRRLRADADDPVFAALRDLDATFAGCRDKAVDMAASVEAVLEARHGALLLAWSLSFDAARRQMRAPKLVGLATLAEFASSPDFSTDAASLSRRDHATLQPYVERWAYLDALCSTQPGVGRLLVLHAYLYALALKKEGLLALAFSSRRGAAPESKRLFEALGFATVIADADFTTRMYGTWFAKSTSDVDLAGVAEEAVRVCTRRGLTSRTADRLLWRCAA